MNDNKSLINIIKQAYDLHVHMGPEVIPRKYNTPQQLIQSLSGKVAGVGLKNHFFSTIPASILARQNNLKVIGSIVLNNFVGGLNPDAVYAASTLAKGPFIVWFPTVSAKQFLDNSIWEVAPEWVDKSKKFIARKAKNVKGMEVKNNENLVEVIRSVKKANAILATGHLSWKESRILVKKAVRMGINKIIVTHPIYQRINMPLSVQKELAQSGAKIEQCWSMWKIDKIPIRVIAKQIKAIGCSNCIISSDSGQSFSPPPNVALYDFCYALLQEGIQLNDLKLMCITNPKILITR